MQLVRCIEELPSTIGISPHSSARSKTIAHTNINAGETILYIPSFVTTLLSSQKGKRCDKCLRIPYESLKRCTGCASYWYCDTECQSADWRIHKRVCKEYSKFIASEAYQKLADHERMDSFLLSHLVSRVSVGSALYTPDFQTFMDLLPSAEVSPPPICVKLASDFPVDMVGTMFQRFGNNNFAIHSHLTSVAHGVFPLASRLFNHSCLPNAAVKYHFSAAKAAVMEVVALRDILVDEEICITYADPALLQTRQKIFEISYGFKCACPSCNVLAELGPLPEAPSDILSLAEPLHKYEISPLHRSNSFPHSLACLASERVLESLTEKFSATSHDGLYSEAITSGDMLLDIYKMIYPPNYPQIGMHLLELAKTMWNWVVESPQTAGPDAERRAREYLTEAEKILLIFGSEGDESGPQTEIKALHGLLPPA